MGKIQEYLARGEVSTSSLWVLPSSLSVMPMRAHQSSRSWKKFIHSWSTIGFAPWTPELILFSIDSRLLPREMSLATTPELKQQITVKKCVVNVRNDSKFNTLLVGFVILL